MPPRPAETSTRASDPRVPLRSPTPPLTRACGQAAPVYSGCSGRQAVPEPVREITESQPFRRPRRLQMRRLEPRSSADDTPRRRGLGGPGAVLAVGVLAVAFAALAVAAHAGWMDSLARFSDRELSPLQYGVQRDHPFAVSWMN